MPVPVEILEQSFDLIAPRGDELADRMYANIFTAAPAALALFAGADMAAQKQKLFATLVMLRNSLRNLDMMVPMLHALGERHAHYGVQPAHYPIVGAALIAAMEAVGGDEWHPEYSESWTAAYRIVQETMLSGAAVTV
jgi:hemoglobin-like flavoprotein